jgi:hypothetical protein
VRIKRVRSDRGRVENTPAATSQLSSNLKAFHALLHYSQLYVRAPWVRDPGGALSQVTSEIAIRIKVGLRRKWYEALLCAFTNLAFRASTADLGVFLPKVDKHILILAIHVDDCIPTCSLPERIAEHKFNARYTLTNLGPVHWFLSIKITRDRSARTLPLSQTSYIDSILICFGLGDAKPYGTPMVPGATYSREDCHRRHRSCAHAEDTLSRGNR